MLGPAGKLADMPAEVKGIMPRALDDLFTSLRGDHSILEWKMSITYIEVYCEVIRDLLTAEKTAREGKGVGVDVQEIKGVMLLKNVAPVEVKSMQVRVPHSRAPPSGRALTMHVCQPRATLAATYDPNERHSCVVYPWAHDLWKERCARWCAGH